MKQTKQDKLAVVRVPDLTDKLAQIDLAPAYVEKRDGLVMALAELGLVTSPETLQEATGIAVRARTFVREVEEMGLDARRPIGALADRVLELQRDLVQPVKEALAAVAARCAAYQAEERERQEREAEERRRKADELAAQEAEARAKADRLAASAHAESTLDRAIAQEAKAEQLAEERRAVLSAPPAAPTQAKGSAFKEVVQYAVDDATGGLPALYAAAPHLVKLELNAAACRAVVTKDTRLPGLKVWVEAVTQFRAKR